MDPRARAHALPGFDSCDCMLPPAMPDMVSKQLTNEHHGVWPTNRNRGGHVCCFMVRWIVLGRFGPS